MAILVVEDGVAIGEVEKLDENREVFSKLVEIGGVGEEVRNRCKVENSEASGEVSVKRRRLWKVEDGEFGGM